MRTRTVIAGVCLSLMASMSQANTNTPIKAGSAEINQNRVTTETNSPEEAHNRNLWITNAPLIANELLMWHVSAEQREIFDQKGRWLKERLSSATKERSSLSPMSEAIAVFSARYTRQPITKPFLDMGVPVPPKFAALQTDTLGATPGIQESIDLIKDCVKTGEEAQTVICHAMAATLAAEWTRPSEREVQLSAKDVFGESENLQTIMDIVGNKIEKNATVTNQLNEVNGSGLGVDQSVIDRSLSVVVTKKSLLKAESYLTMMVPIRYE